MNGLLWAAAGTGFTFSMTTLGAAVVFFMRKEGQSEKVQKAFLGFAAGVMIAASVWSLLIPAINEAEALGRIGWIPAAGGFALGVLFLMGLDKAMPYFLPEPEREEHSVLALSQELLSLFSDFSPFLPQVLSNRFFRGFLPLPQEQCSMWWWRSLSPKHIWGKVTWEQLA